MAQVERNHYSQRQQHYTAQIQQDDKSAPHLNAQSVKPTTKEDSGLIGKIFLLVIIIAVLVWAGLFLWRSAHHAKDPIPATIKRSVSFPLYYPTAEPKGYTLDPVSIANANGTIFYNLVKNPGDPPIVVSQQSVPKNFDPKSMFQHNPLPTTISPLGTIYDLSNKSQSRFMVAAQNSLIFISSSTKITNPQLQEIIEGLKQSL